MQSAELKSYGSVDRSTSYSRVWEGCHVWLWATWSMIREAAPHELLSAWGVRCAGEFVPDKKTLGIGCWFRGRTEVLICAVNLPLLSDRIDSVVSLRRGRHSAGPEEFVLLSGLRT